MKKKEKKKEKKKSTGDHAKEDFHHMKEYFHSKRTKTQITHTITSGRSNQPRI